MLMKLAGTAYGQGMQGICDGHDISAGRWPANLALCHSPHCRPLGTRQVQGTNRSNDRSGTMFGGNGVSIHTPDYASPEGHGDRGGVGLRRGVCCGGLQCAGGGAE